MSSAETGRLCVADPSLSVVPTTLSTRPPALQMTGSAGLHWLTPTLFLPPAQEMVTLVRDGPNGWLFQQQLQLAIFCGMEA